jgi:hypothetical protein
MPDVKPIAGNADIVHGGEKNRISTIMTTDGTRWKPKSAKGLRGGAHSGITSLGSI